MRALIICGLMLWLPGCGVTPEREPRIDDPDAWRALCRDGTRIRAAREEGMCDRHGGVSLWLNRARESADVNVE
ncbi:DUF3761 domain-containing protein [Aeromonas schubertii]|nr:DUF3761 domain-containing protein [Aeromonas schubertii]